MNELIKLNRSHDHCEIKRGQGAREREREIIILNNILIIAEYCKKDDNDDDDDIDTDNKRKRRVDNYFRRIYVRTVQAMYIYVCVYTVYLYVYIRGETMTECDVNGQSATYQLGNQWYRLPARSNVRHTVDSAVEIVSRMSGT